MKKSKLLSLLLCIAVLLSCIVYMPAANVATKAAVATEKAFFIGSTSATNRVADVIFPFNLRRAEDESWSFYVSGSGSVTYPLRLKFKYKVLSGSSNPRVGLLETSSGSDTTNVGATIGDITYSNGVCTANFNVTVRGASAFSYPNMASRGLRFFYITIGNAVYSSASDSVALQSFDSSFIISNIQIYSSADSYTKDILNCYPSHSYGINNEDNVVMDGTYYFRGNGTNTWDSPCYAEANKWSLLGSSQYTKYIDVPSDYNTSSNYNAGNFTSHAATNLTYQYYTNSKYSGLTFSKLDNSNNAGYEVISEADIAKQMIIIKPNDQGENEPQDTGQSGDPVAYKNKAANIFIPLSLEQYISSSSNLKPSGQYLVAKVTFKADRLSGSFAPVIGRISAEKRNNSGQGSCAYGNSTLNVRDAVFHGVGGHNIGTGDRCTYDASTGEFTGWVLVCAADGDWRSKFGINEIITIGNAEHGWRANKYDSTAMTCSFAIWDINIQLYTYTTDGSSKKVHNTAIAGAENIAPDLRASHIDTVSNYYHQPGTGTKPSNGYDISNHDKDVLRGSQQIWSVDGETGLVSNYPLTDCIRQNHTLTHHAATMNNTTGVGTREYWSCSCGKNFADNYGATQITDTSAKKKMLVVDTVSSGESIAYIPVEFKGFEGLKWFKFTCDVRKDGSGTPKITDARAVTDGVEAAYTPNDDGNSNIKIYSSSYANNKLTAYILMWKIGNGYKPYAYENPVSGAHMVLNIGNADYELSDYSNIQTNTTFYFSNPELKALDCAGSANYDTASAASTTGDNLVPDFTDKTVRFDNAAYAYTNAPIDGSDASGKLRTGSGTPVSAPLGVWGTTGTSYAKVTTQDIKAGLFEGTNYSGNKMLCLSGKSVQNRAIKTEADIPAGGGRYTFEIDYRAVGGAKADIEALVDWTNSNNFTLQPTNGSTGAYVYDDGYHYRVVFDTWSNTRTFRLYLGQQYNEFNNGAVYFANARFYKNSVGTNLLSNGTFSAGLDTKIEANFNRKVIEGWSDEGGIFNLPYVTAERIPSGFFSNDASTNYTNVYEFKGSSGYKPSFGFTVDESESYRITYNYDCAKNRAVNLYFTCDTPSRTKTLVKSTGLNKTSGKFEATYTFTNTTSYRDNCVFTFALNGNNYDSAFSVSNIRIYKLNGSGNTVGTNLAFDLNTILSNADYGVASASSASFTLAANNLVATRKDVYGGGVRRWFGNTNKGNSDYSKVVKTDGNLFKYYTVDERYEYARAAVLNGASNVVSQSSSKFYDPNGDSTVDVLDMVRLELDSQNNTDTQFSAANSAS